MLTSNLILPGEFRKLAPFHHRRLAKFRTANSVARCNDWFLCLLPILNSKKNVLFLLIYNNKLVFHHRKLLAILWFCLSILLSHSRAFSINTQTRLYPYIYNHFVSLSMQIYHLTFNLRISEASVYMIVAMKTYHFKRKNWNSIVNTFLSYDVKMMSMKNRP